MNGFKLFGKEIGTILKDKKLLIPVIVVMFIPILYSAMFLWAFWDPYAKLDRIPVAVVNMDEGAIFNDEEMNIGKELEDKLREEPEFNWVFVNQDQALKGLEENLFYMVIEIPDDFSQRATTVLDEEPIPLELRYLPNESYNFLASQIGETAMDKVRAKIATNLTEKYTEVVFDHFSELSDGLQKATDGASQLADGAFKAYDGVTTIQNNLAKLANGSHSLKNGLGETAQGSIQLHEGLTALHLGLDQLTAGTTQLEQGYSQLLDGANQAGVGIDQLNEGVKASVTGLKQSEMGAEQLALGLQQYAQANPTLANDPMFQALVENSQKLASGITQITAGQERVSEGAEKLALGNKELTSGMTLFQQKLAEIKTGSVALSNGAEDALQGSMKLQQALQQLDQGATEIAQGASKLSNGSVDLKAGMITLNEGISTLEEKLADAAKETADVKGDDKVYEMFADPVRLSTEKIAEVPNYGTGFAPYFLSLGLFVGALIISIVLPMRTPAGPPKSAFSWFFSKYTTLLLIGIIQALLADFILLVGLGIEVKSVPYFIMISIITSLTFVSIIHFLATAFDNPGRFIAILMLIMQLTTSAGTFPLEVIPDSLQGFNPWLPMTYSVTGLKAVISSGNFSLMWESILPLFGFMVIGMIGSLVTYMILFKRMKKSGAEIGATA